MCLTSLHTPIPDVCSAFSFASAPHEDKVLFFIKREGSWTIALHDMCKYHLERKRRRNAFKFEVKIRGPYGAPAEHATQYDKVLLISGGVGATPFCRYAHHLGFFVSFHMTSQSWYLTDFMTPPLIPYAFICIY